MARRSILAVALVCLTSVVGCANPPGAVGVEVNGLTQSLEDINSKVDSCVNDIGLDPNAARSTVTQAVIWSLMGEYLINERGAQDQRDQLNAFLRAPEQQGFPVEKECGRTVVEGVRGEFIVGAAVQNRLVAQTNPFQGIDIKVNPRLGSWDEAGAGVVLASGSLSVPSETYQQLYTEVLRRGPVGN